MHSLHIIAGFTRMDWGDRAMVLSVQGLTESVHLARHCAGLQKHMQLALQAQPAMLP